MSKSVEEIKKIIGKGDGGDELSSILAVELEGGSLGVVDVVLALEELLTSEDKDLRARGTKILAQLLHLLPHHFLAQSDCRYLLTFFLGRLQDHYTIVPSALTGLAALTLMEKCPDEAAADILDGLQKNVICQTLTVSHRYTFYSIFHNLFLKKKMKVLSELSSEFLFGLISGMSSEHDPRNLLFLFSFLPTVFSQTPLKHLKEDAFIVLESYFPVDYNPINENDPITREGLAKSLEACFTSTADFGDLCLPLIIEKLESSLPVAQTDSLKLLASGMKKWGLEGVSERVEEVWGALRGVLVSTQVTPLAGEALIAVLEAFSVQPLGDKETKAFYFLLHSLSSCTHSFLSDPGLSLFSPTVRLLSQVAAVSSVTADFIIPRVMPQLVALLESNCSPTNKETVLKNLHPLLQTSIIFNSWESEVCKNLLEKVPPTLMKLLPHSDTCGAALLCLSAIYSKNDQSSREEIFNFIKTFLPLESSKNTRDEFGHFMKVMSEAYPEEVQNSILSAFPIPGWNLDAEKRTRLVELLVSVAEAEPLTLPTAQLFLKFISEDAVEYSQWRTATVFILRERCGGRGGLLGGLAREFPSALLARYISSPPDEETIAAATLTSLILRTLPLQDQTSIMLKGLQLLSEQKNASGDPTTDLVLLEGLLSGLGRGVEVPDCRARALDLLQLALSSPTPLARTSAARLLALIINKASPDELVTGVLGSASLLIRENAASVELCAWIAKALVLRDHPQAGSWLDQLLKFTSHENIGMEAAHGVRLVLEENPVLSAENFCNIGILYKQRVFEKFNLLIPPCGQPSKAASLALAYILKYSPPSLVVGRLEKLARVMVHCLDDGEEVVTRAVLDILSSLLQSALPQLISYAEDFIPRFIRLAKSSPFMEVRYKALDCIYFYAGYKTEDVLPYKTNVVSELRSCLDDKKRLVRQSAVRTRTRWFVV